MRRLRAVGLLLALGSVLAVGGCARPFFLEGVTFAGERPFGAVYVVAGTLGRSRDFQDMIVESMHRRGLRAVTGERADADFVVTYRARWAWDMRDYLVDLRIDVRDADSNLLVATARSYQNSLTAMGRTHEAIIDDVVETLLGGDPRARTE